MKLRAWFPHPLTEGSLQVLSAMMQIQQGMQRLTNAAPGLLPGMGINPMGGTARPPPAAGNLPNNAYNMQNLMSQVCDPLIYLYLCIEIPLSLY